MPDPVPLAKVKELLAEEATRRNTPVSVPPSEKAQRHRPPAQADGLLWSLDGFLGGRDSKLRNPCSPQRHRSRNFFRRSFRRSAATASPG